MNPPATTTDEPQTDVQADAAQTALIDRWFPVGAVDEACKTPAGSGRNEKAIFAWFASRPIAQARAAVLCSLLGDAGDDDTALHSLVDDAILAGRHETLEQLAAEIGSDADGRPPVVVDCFSGRGIIPLEAARLGLRAVGVDVSPVAVLASRLLAEYPLRDWSSEPAVTFPASHGGNGDSGTLFEADAAPKLIGDLRAFFAEVDRRCGEAVRDAYPAGPNGTQPWGYLWATTMPCDNCGRRFPLVGSLVTRHPYHSVGDPGEWFSVDADTTTGTWQVTFHDGVPDEQPTMVAPRGSRGKSARCPFDDCRHVHPLETVKTKGQAGQFGDAPLAAADIVAVAVTDTNGRSRTVERKVFRTLTAHEAHAATNVDVDGLEPFGDLPAVPHETIAAGNTDSVRGTGYGYTTWGSLMNVRQGYLFAQTVAAIRATRAAAVAAGISDEYGTVLAAYATANLIRRLRYSTRGVTVRPHGNAAGSGQNRTQVTDLFANESHVGFSFDWFETGPGGGPGTWRSLTTTTLTPLTTHLEGLPQFAEPARFRRASATALPYRTGTVDAVVCDPPYYSMIDYADISDLFYVWARRCLFDLVGDLFGVAGDPAGLQDKSEEIIVKRSPEAGDHRTTDWYETQLARAFAEMRRVLKPGGTLTVVFGHSDPAAWRRLLGALRDAEFIVTSAWPARTETTNTGVASIRVTVTIGCRVAPDGRSTTTAAQAEREIVNLVRRRVPKWEAWGLALSDQLMASYGPAMQIVGKYRSIVRPDGTEPDLDHFLAVGRRAVADTHAFKVDDLPLDTFDPATRFAIFWLRAFGTSVVGHGEAVFHAQSSQMRIDELRPEILEDVKGGFRLCLDEPPPIGEHSPVILVARALGYAWDAGGTEAAAATLAASRLPADDPHLWATVGELVCDLDDSGTLAKALTACQRNRRPIETAARHATAAADAATPSLFTTEESS